jgi:hypothetical protein
MQSDICCHRCLRPLAETPVFGDCFSP